MKHYVCLKTIEAVKISTAVKNEAGDWTVYGGGELHNIPSSQAKNMKFTKRDQKYLVRYGNGAVEVMPAKTFENLYGELSNGVFDGTFDEALTKAEEAPHLDESLVRSDKRGYERSVKRSSQVDFADEKEDGFDYANVVTGQPTPEKLGAFVPASPHVTTVLPLVHGVRAQPVDARLLPPATQPMKQVHAQQEPMPTFMRNGSSTAKTPVFHTDELNRDVIDKLRSVTEAELSVGASRKGADADATPVAESEMNFSQALSYLKSMYPVARRSWAAEGKFIYYAKPSKVMALIQPLLRVLGGPREVTFEARIDMYKGNNSLGRWVPTDEDMVGTNDWYIL